MTWQQHYFTARFLSLTRPSGGASLRSPHGRPRAPNIIDQNIILFSVARRIFFTTTTFLHLFSESHKSRFFYKIAFFADYSRFFEQKSSQFRSFGAVRPLIDSSRPRASLSTISNLIFRQLPKHDRKVSLLLQIKISRVKQTCWYFTYIYFVARKMLYKMCLVTYLDHPVRYLLKSDLWDGRRKIVSFWSTPGLR